MNYRKYPISSYNEQYLKRLNSKNATIQNNEILNNNNDGFYNPSEDGDSEMFDQLLNNNSTGKRRSSGVRIIINKSVINQLSADLQNANNVGDTDEQQSDYYDIYGNPMRSYGKRGESSSSRTKKSENFEVIEKSPINFNDVGGYNNIKNELNQCIDILSNYAKYAPYNVRVPKGLIFEGPPGNGKTLLAKALAGEAKTGFIAVSGSEFQEKYVGVGSSRIRELFKLAKQNIPCIIFIDEIDALGRKRSSDGDTSGNERDSTLNELLVALDGFKNTSGIFVIGATNRADLLDTALTRPGRIDKRIYIGNPDEITRKAILNIHSSGKPYDSTIHIDNLVEITNGFSGAQIENLLNEAMLNALRENRNKFTNSDIDVIVNKMLAGWQPSEHQFTTDIIDQIAIHELGHAIVGMLSTHHAKMTKVIINLSSPNSPAYTVFESSNTNIFTRDALFEHLMILLAGRIAEEVFYGVSVTTGAINDFEEALKLAEKMVCYYGMGKKIIYPSMSEKYKEIIDEEVAVLINDAYGYAEFIIRNSKELIEEGSDILKRDKIISYDSLVELMNLKYKSVLNLKI
jgi:cell division protease FtsH